MTAAEIDIRPAAQQMLADIGHPFAKGEKVYDVTFENVQAGLRTDYLFRLANQHNGFVLGTGDLSELALGWCTYGVGDQMSHYNVNGSVAKTLIQHLIRFVAASDDVDAGDGRDPARHPGHRDLAGAGAGRRQGRHPVDRAVGRALRAAGLQPLLHHAASASGRPRSPSSPGTPGATRDGRLAAELPGRHAARLRPGRDPAAGWRCSCAASSTSQFKRSAMPNGPKISSGGSLSPRGDWRAPSDGSPDVWLAELSSVPQTKK